MKKDNYKTDVIFRVDKDETVFAIFPHSVCTHSGLVTTYEHVGQHSGGDYNRCINKSKLVTEAQFRSLKQEMESLGYNLQIRKKRNYAKYLAEYKKINS